MGRNSKEIKAPSATTGDVDQYSKLVVALCGNKNPNRIFSLAEARIAIMFGMGIGRQTTWDLMLAAEGRGLITIGLADGSVSITEKGRTLL